MFCRMMLALYFCAKEHMDKEIKWQQENDIYIYKSL